jgi:glucose-1-phosphate cytidylyltransferase
MKVVLFCGGLGTRLREYAPESPKPLVNIGHRPILWHLMSYYAHFGHKDFILCLGYRGELIREYFVNYREWLSNDFVLSQGGRKIELMSHDIDDWRITFVDTGQQSNVGQRLLRVRSHLQHEEMFLANYADALTDLPLDEQIGDFGKRNAAVSFLAVPPATSFHGMRSARDGVVTDFGTMRESGFWINGGYFCMRPSVFDHIREGEDLVEQPFQRLVATERLVAYQYSGFWQQMDTLKDKIAYDHLEERGHCPWKVWKRGAGC